MPPDPLPLALGLVALVVVALLIVHARRRRFAAVCTRCGWRCRCTTPEAAGRSAAAHHVATGHEARLWERTQ